MLMVLDMKRKDAVDALMSQYGFKLHRKTKHRTYINNEGITITCSSSSSDVNVLRQIKRQIRRTLNQKVVV